MIIDSHVHLPSPGWSGHSSFLKTVAEAIAYLRKAGIQGVVFNTWQGVFAKTERDLDAGNRDALRLAKRYAGFLHPSLVIHPDFPKASEAWLRRFHDLGLGWVGELVPPDPAPDSLAPHVAPGTRDIRAAPRFREQPSFFPLR